MAQTHLREEVIIAGFGGQGIILAGKLLAQTAMESGKEITYIPSYGAEMRGGTANCSVIISDDTISCPFINNPDSVIMMNNTSFDKFTPRLKPEGLLVFNSSLVAQNSANQVIDRPNTIAIPADKIAVELGNVKIANMVIIGAYIQAKGQLELENAINALPDVLAKRYHSMLPLNTKALQEGARFAQTHLASIP